MTEAQVDAAAAAWWARVAAREQASGVSAEFHPSWEAIKIERPEVVRDVHEMARVMLAAAEAAA